MIIVANKKIRKKRGRRRVVIVEPKEESMRHSEKHCIIMKVNQYICTHHYTSNAAVLSLLLYCVCQEVHYNLSAWAASFPPVLVVALLLFAAELAMASHLKVKLCVVVRVADYLLVKYLRYLHRHLFLRRGVVFALDPHVPAAGPRGRPWARWAAAAPGPRPRSAGAARRRPAGPAPPGSPPPAPAPPGGTRGTSSARAARGAGSPGGRRGRRAASAPPPAAGRAPGTPCTRRRRCRPARGRSGPPGARPRTWPRPAAPAAAGSRFLPKLGAY
mmetsp:Transcript_30922/g.51341  ORF Transcript_30922/g.51341 Transcript_30922/m.51341 type:complete len:273 (+) Transcript_30922:90-908(+)